MISERAFSQAFHSFWKEVTPFLTPHYITLFNEAYREDLTDEDGEQMGELDIPEELDRADVAAELGFRLAKVAHQHRAPLNDNEWIRRLVPYATEEMRVSFSGHSGPRPPVDPTDAEVCEALRLCSRYAAFYRMVDGAEILFCPPLQGVGVLNSCEADISVGSMLVEVKTTTRRVSGRDLRQVLVYLALGSVQKTFKWSEFGIFNPRRAEFSRITIDVFIAQISGGKSAREVYAEILSFVESSDLVLDQQF